MIWQIQVLFGNVLQIGNLAGILATQKPSHLQVHIVLRSDEQIWLIGHCAFEAGTIHLDEEQIQGSDKSPVLIQDLVLRGITNLKT